MAVTRKLAKLCRANDAGGGSALDDLRRLGDRDIGAGHAAAGLHDEQPRRRAGIAQLVLQRREIVKNWRPDIGIDHRSTGALVLAQLRQDIAGQRNENAGQGSAQYLAGKALVDRVRVGMKEADGYGLDLLGAEQFGDAFDIVGIQRCDDLAARPHPLIDLEAEMARHQRFGLFVEGLI